MKRKLLAMLSVLTVVLGLSISNASAVTTYDYASPLTMNMSTTDLGGGTWHYDLSFLNTDTSNIWHFMVWTSASTFNVIGNLSNYDNGHAVPGGVASQYNATNIDPGISWMAHMWENPFGGSNGIQIGNIGTFSFDTSYYTSSLLYGYETGASGWAQSNETGNLAAVGVATTAHVPEPSTLLLLGSGLLGFGFFARKRIKG